jgi:tetratricopeptide (TPR) repeat protein
MAEEPPFVLLPSQRSAARSARYWSGSHAYAHLEYFRHASAIVNSQALLGKEPYMKIVLRCIAAFLLVSLISPKLAQAGGDIGIDPYEAGEKLFVGKHYKTALKYYQRALERNDVRAHYRMGLIYEANGKSKEALSHYQSFMDLGQPDAQRSDTAQRIGAIEAQLKREATRSTGLLERGKSLFGKRKYREAERVLLQAAAKDKSNPEIHFYLGEVYMGLEAYRKAKSEYNKAKGYY